MVRRTDLVVSLRRKVGWFVIAGGVFFLLLLLIVSVRTDVFATKFSLFIHPPSAASFHIGQEVKFQGFTIGRVHGMELLPEGKVRVELRLFEKYRRMIHRGAKVRLNKVGLLGEQIVEISSGDPDAPIVQDGDEVTYETEATIEQFLLDLKPAVANLNDLVRELALLAKWLNAPEGDLRRAIKQIRGISEDLSKADIGEHLKQLGATLMEIQALTRQMTEQHLAKVLADAVKQMQRILKHVEPLAREMGKTGPETLEKTKQLLMHVDRLVEALNLVAQDLAELTPELPGLARESRDTIKEMRGLIEGLRQSWLFGGKTIKREGDEELVGPPVSESLP